MKKVIFQTLGCKVNQYETQGMREKLLRSGFAETDEVEDADLLVLNTCTVTGEGDKKSRYLIRRMHRLNPNAKIIVTGCYAEKNRDEIFSIEGVTEVLGQNEKDKILDSALRLLDINDSNFSMCRGQDDSALNARKRFADLSITDFQGFGRAFVKVQDGCNHACSFCKVVIVRGRSRSREFQSIIDESKRLVDMGFLEIVLTGIQLGAYGDDFASQISLSKLVEALTEIPKLERVRLSSIEPTDVTDDLIALAKNNSKFCPHLHIPLQSGDDAVLKKMRRRYDSGFYRELVLRLQREVKAFALTADVMCGFPGETEQQFQNTIALLEELKPLKIHAFPYSKREGTLSSKFSDEVALGIIDARRRKLVEASAIWQSNFISQYLGVVFSVIVEEKLEGSICRGRTSNYMLVEFESDAVKLGDLVDVQLEHILDDRAWGVLKERMFVC
ncbi:MAG: tRNA (N(6)-L-threonylcarbamoyladenosine(37)-C(2))-methylthiotransferase MtaB [Candidatus Omnitrophica bacterium]|nr:tRNA (N(6)-L-threonylcarbamoyladenosine(37)-C(2))-methylthiotransferase MtaB [Candidatus Omnitrophota bacterium]